MEDITDLRELTVSYGMMEAEIIKSKLESFGIPCMLKFETMGRLGITTDGIGQVQVMVPPDYLARAQEIISTENNAKDDD